MQPQQEAERPLSSSNWANMAEIESEKAFQAQEKSEKQQLAQELSKVDRIIQTLAIQPPPPSLLEQKDTLTSKISQLEKSIAASEKFTDILEWCKQNTEESALFNNAINHTAVNTLLGKRMSYSLFKRFYKLLNQSLTTLEDPTINAFSPTDFYPRPFDLKSLFSRYKGQQTQAVKLTVEDIIDNSLQVNLRCVGRNMNYKYNTIHSTYLCILSIALSLLTQSSSKHLEHFSQLSCNHLQYFKLIYPIYQLLAIAYNRYSESTNVQLGNRLLSSITLKTARDLTDPKFVASLHQTYQTEQLKPYSGLFIVTGTKTKALLGEELEGNIKTIIEQKIIELSKTITTDQPEKREAEWILCHMKKESQNAKVIPLKESSQFLPLHTIRS